MSLYETKTYNVFLADHQLFKMEALYHQTNRLLQETQQCFQDLSFNRPEVEKEIQARIDQITR